MRHRDVERRLEALEAAQTHEARTADGYAPEAWTRLAPWAIAVHEAGGWKAAIALVKAGQRLPQPDPYAGRSGGATWDIVLFCQCGNTARMPTREQEQDGLYLITCCVAQLLDAGVPHAVIQTWNTGRAVWQAITNELEGGHDAEL